MTGPASPAPQPERTSRRGFLLVAAGAVVAAGGAGTAAALAHRDPRDARVAGPSPTVLTTALAAEDSLIATIDAMGAPAELAHLRADHVQHRAAVFAALQQAAGTPSPSVPRPSGAPSGASSHGAKPTLAELGAAEQAASLAAAVAAEGLDGADAALLASISACEASHAELLR